MIGRYPSPLLDECYLNRMLSLEAKLIALLQLVESIARRGPSSFVRSNGT